MAALVNQGAAYTLAGEVAPRMGNAHRSIAPYDLLRAGDGELVIAVGTDAQFRALAVTLVGRPGVLEFLALAGFLAPCVLALLAAAGVSLELLESAALACFAALIGYMIAITGGMRSPFVVWFALVPAEAALAEPQNTTVKN